MRRRFLKFLATFTFRFAWLIMPLCLGATAVAVWFADGINFDMSLVAFLPSDRQQQFQVGEVIGDYRRLEPVMAVIRARNGSGKSAELIAIAREMARQLNNPNFFAEPVYKIDEVWRRYYESLSDIRLIMLLTSRDWDELRRLMSQNISASRLNWEMAWRISLVKPPHPARSLHDDPLGALAPIRQRLASSRGPTRLEAADGYLLSTDRNAIAILLYPVLSPDNGRDACRTLGFLEDSRDFIFKTHPAWRGAYAVEFEGTMVDTARQLGRMNDDRSLILWITTPLVLLLILLVFRKVEAFFFILLPPAMGLAWTFALARLAFGGISVVTAGFLLVILALGIQYSIHLYHRFILELYRTHNYYRALTRSYLETGRGILASAVVVALLFFLLFATSLRDVEDWGGALHVLHDSRGFGQIGVVAALGILCNLAACLLALPLLAAIKHRLAWGRVKPVGLYRFQLERLYEPAIDNPRAALLVMVLVTVFLGFPTRDLDFSPVAVAPFLFQPEPAHNTAKAEFPRPGRPIVATVKGKTIQEALERNDQLYENLIELGDRYNILAYDSLRPVLPSLRSQRASLARLAALDLEPFRRRIESTSRAAGFQPAIMAPFLDALEKFKAAASNPHDLTINYTIGDDDKLFGTLSSTVPRYMTTRDGMVVVTTVIYPNESGFPPASLNQLAAELKRNGLEDLKLIGDPLIERDLSQLIKFNAAVMVLLSVFFIYFALLLHFRSMRLAWLTFLPVLAEIAWLGGLMALTNIQIHFFTILAMPLVLGLAMDNALQLTQFFHDRRPRSVRYVMLSVGRVAMLTCGVTALLYGTFALASYPGVRDFGVVVLYASALVPVGTVMLLPALLSLFGRGQPLREALMIEGEP